MDTAAAAPLPTITHREVSWHTVCAAIRARRQAEAQGMDPQAREALARASSAPVPGKPPVTLGTLWAMEASEPHLATLCGSQRYADQALVAHTLLHPETTLLAFLEGDVQAVAAGMIETSAVVSAELAVQLDQWFAAEMLRLRHLAGGGVKVDPAKKKPMDLPNPSSAPTAAPAPDGRPG